MSKNGNSLMTDLGLLGLRLVVGGLLAGHGAQKLFGKFGGHGLKATAGWMESIGMKPGDRWAAMAGASEFGGGVLTATGLLSPVGPITLMAPMTVAWLTVHKDKPIWATEGGAEMPLANIAAASALTLGGPGRFSLDSLLGIKLPFFLVLLAAAATAAGVYVSLSSREQPPAPAEPRMEASDTTTASESTSTAGSTAPTAGNGATPSPGATKTGSPA